MRNETDQYKDNEPDSNLGDEDEDVEATKSKGSKAGTRYYNLYEDFHHPSYSVSESYYDKNADQEDEGNEDEDDMDEIDRSDPITSQTSHNQGSQAKILSPNLV